MADKHATLYMLTMLLVRICRQRLAMESLARHSILRAVRQYRCWTCCRCLNAFPRRQLRHNSCRRGPGMCATRARISLVLASNWATNPIRQSFRGYCERWTRLQIENKQATTIRLRLLVQRFLPAAE